MNNMKKIIYLLTLQLSLSFSVFTYAQVSNELSGKAVWTNGVLDLEAWGVRIVEEN